MGCELLEWIPSLVLGVVAAVAVVGPVSRVVASSIEEEKARLHDSLGHVVGIGSASLGARRAARPRPRPVASIRP